MSQRAMIAVEYERVFAEQAKKRRVASRVENLPHDEPQHGPKASDEAGDLFNVSGRTVRDAQKARNGAWFAF